MSDKPEPPAEVWVNQRGVYGDVPLSDPTCPRYVLAPEGSAVIPPELVDLWCATFVPHHWSSEAGKATDAILRAARGGAS